MKRTTYFVCLVNILVQGDFNSNFMLRNPSYDNRGTNAVHVISSSNSNSRLACASQCTAWGECKSVMFNMNTNECQLLSIHMGDQSDAGPHSSIGWLYYEKQFDCTIWHQRFGHWYLLDSNYRTFNDSRTFCASLSPPAYVIEVQSETENDWLIELTSTLCGVPYEYWLNGYDTDNSGTFTWIDSQTPSTYTNWYTGEPNGIGSEKCIASSTGYEGAWVDIPCTFSRPVVCERNF
ncbi:C-type lectin mannose-binding isoform-like [Crassostrea angulata]|uniref:C-type lectin mannose-binding isoform-like n=1 Tax=Magallana angulata TaxID=2784310 RepID=UPI0022B107D3|nr:C-type lectin mannose-binding isoform-like [Crassostrea angulata]